MEILYLDNCCFNRPYDDQSKLRIRLETEAKLQIQEDIRSGFHGLVWSYILDYENSRNPFQEKREQILKWKRRSIVYVQEDRMVLEVATFLNGQGLKKLDALHVACAKAAKCHWFLTTDEGILKRATMITNIKITDPIGFIKEVST